MDSETVRLFIATAGGVAAGLGAAGINSRATFRNSERSHEHQRTEDRRSVKVEIYTQYLTQLERYRSHLDEAYRAKRIDAADMLSRRREIERVIATSSLLPDGGEVLRYMRLALASTAPLLDIVTAAKGAPEIKSPDEWATMSTKCTAAVNAVTEAMVSSLEP